MNVLTISLQIGNAKGKKGKKETEVNERAESIPPSFSDIAVNKTIPPTVTNVINCLLSSYNSSMPQDGREGNKLESRLYVCSIQSKVYENSSENENAKHLPTMESKC